MRRHRARSALNAEINVVSLIDVMMLLMVIFMITAPMMQGGVDVALPTGEARPLEPKSGLVVTVDRGAKIFVDRKSYIFLKGTTLDYDTALLTQGFVFHNPNAKQTCGCGSSFGA